VTFGFPNLATHSTTYATQDDFASSKGKVHTGVSQGEVYDYCGKKTAPKTLFQQD
jgi:hypothetical protein